MPKDLKKLPLDELRQMWSDAWKIKVNLNIGRKILEKSLEYKVLEQQGKGLSPDQLTKLNKLIKVYKQHPQRFETREADLKEGTRLVRIWKGEKHVVTVTGIEFEYRGITYGSLSRIANVITGKKWNGWVFFGLKSKKTKS